MIGYEKSGIEPNLDELMEDPIVQLLMESDGVSMSTLMPLIAEISGHMQLRTTAA